MSATGDALGAAILSNKAAAQKAFLASLRGRPALPTDNVRLVLMLAQAEGNAIADNLPQSGSANWDGGQASTNYGGTVAIDGGGA